MPQLPQCLGFNLADTLAGDPKGLAHFFQRALGPVFEAESHFDHTFFARSYPTSSDIGQKSLAELLCGTD